MNNIFEVSKINYNNWCLVLSKNDNFTILQTGLKKEIYETLLKETEKREKNKIFLVAENKIKSETNEYILDYEFATTHKGYHSSLIMIEEKLIINSPIKKV
jgi:hypothetical protein